MIASEKPLFLEIVAYNAIRLQQWSIRAMRWQGKDATCNRMKCWEQICRLVWIYDTTAEVILEEVELPYHAHLWYVAYGGQFPWFSSGKVLTTWNAYISNHLFILGSAILMTRMSSTNPRKPVRHGPERHVLFWKILNSKHNWQIPCIRSYFLSKTL